MSKTNPEAKKLVDEYIVEAPKFAQPICRKLRKIIKKADPEMVEDWKWKRPTYLKNGMVCGIGAFKEHVSLFFFKGSLIKDPDKLFIDSEDGKAMGTMKFTLSKEVDEKVLLSYIQEAVAVNDKGEKPKKKANKTIKVPNDLKKALQKNKKAWDTFSAFSYSHKKEYIEWVEEAKRPATRENRIAKTVEMVGKGEKKNQKYMKKK